MGHHIDCVHAHTAVCKRPKARHRHTDAVVASTFLKWLINSHVVGICDTCGATVQFDHLKNVDSPPVAVGVSMCCRCRHAIPETLEWHDARDLPDDDTTVLIRIVDTSPRGEPVWLGYHNAGDPDFPGWLTVDAEPLEDGEVTHWAHIPAGPTVSSISPGAHAKTKKRPARAKHLALPTNP